MKYRHFIAAFALLVVGCNARPEASSKSFPDFTGQDRPVMVKPFWVTIGAAGVEPLVGKGPFNLRISVTLMADANERGRPYQDETGLINIPGRVVRDMKSTDRIYIDTVRYDGRISDYISGDIDIMIAVEVLDQNVNEKIYCPAYQGSLESVEGGSISFECLSRS